MYDQVAQNKRRSLVLTAIFVVLVGAVVAAVLYLFDLGIVGVLIAAAVAGGSAFASWWKSDEVALRLSRAREADPVTYARLHNLVEGLCIASGLPKPRLYVIEDVAPNAFATGRNPQHAAVAVTTGLLDLLDRVELEGVLAHELSHIKNDDILVATLAVTMVGLVTLLADLSIRMMWWNGGRRGRNDPEGGAAPWLGFIGLGILVLSPLLSRLMQYAVSRRRESLADVSAVEMTRYPPGLISALEKLRDDTTVVAASSRATAHLWIEAPVARVEEEGKLSRWNAMFATHPPIEDRIAALREL
ncbi:MAG: M48 family metallopeptidase [Actinobacteria bacterium]|nr:M48 family metallopeptidase [Actinomycetota bacterium]